MDFFFLIYFEKRYASLLYSKSWLKILMLLFINLFIVQSDELTSGGSVLNLREFEFGLI